MRRIASASASVLGRLWHLVRPAPDTRKLLLIAACLTCITAFVCYMSLGPSTWIVYSNVVFLVPALAAVLRGRRWLLCLLLMFVGAASTAYHAVSNVDESSYSESTLYHLRQTDHVASLYVSAVVVSLPFTISTPDARLANGVTLPLAAGATVAAVWYTMATDLEAITDVAVALGTPVLSHWLQMIFAVARLRDWQCALAWNLGLLQLLLPTAVGVALGIAFAWNPYTVSVIVATALLTPFIMQLILAVRSHAWQSTSLAALVHLLIDIHPVEGATFIFVALLLSLSALSLLWTPETTDDWQWHGFWHVLAAIAGTFVIWHTPFKTTHSAYSSAAAADDDFDDDERSLF